MDKATLVGVDLLAGRRVVEELERRGVQVDVALWLQDWETGEWRLVLSSPAVASQGPRKIYSLIMDVLESSPEIDLQLEDMSVLSLHDSLIKDLKRQVRTGNDLYDVRLDDVVLGGSRFRSARIYRVSGASLENGARVRIRASGRLGTVRGLIPTPSGPRYRVFYDRTPDDVRRLGTDVRWPIGDDHAAQDLELLYVVRTGGWPEKLPEVTRLRDLART